MTEGGDGIQLNLSSGPKAAPPSKRPPPSGGSDSHDENPSKKAKNIHEGASNETPADTRKLGGSANESGGPVVSSLFKHNPEIPQLNFDSEVSISILVHAVVGMLLTKKQVYFGHYTQYAL